MSGQLPNSTFKILTRIVNKMCTKQLQIAGSGALQAVERADAANPQDTGTLLPAEQYRRDPLNNPAQRRLEPVSSLPGDPLQHQTSHGPVRHRRAHGLEHLSQAYAQAQSTTKRVTVPLRNTARSDRNKMPLVTLPVPLTMHSESSHNGYSARLSPPSHSLTHSPHHMPGNFGVSVEERNAPNPHHRADITDHVQAEAILFDPDVASSLMEPDDEEVNDMLNPPLLSSFDFVAGETLQHEDDVWRKSNLVRKRLVEDDGSDLHGRDLHPGSGPCQSSLGLTLHQSSPISLPDVSSMNKLFTLRFTLPVSGKKRSHGFIASDRPECLPKPAFAPS